MLASGSVRARLRARASHVGHASCARSCSGPSGAGRICDVSGASSAKSGVFGVRSARGASGVATGSAAALAVPDASGAAGSVGSLGRPVQSARRATVGSRRSVSATTSARARSPAGTGPSSSLGHCVSACSSSRRSSMSPSWARRSVHTDERVLASMISRTRWRFGALQKKRRAALSSTSRAPAESGEGGERPERDGEPAKLEESRAIELVGERGFEVGFGRKPGREAAVSLERDLDGFLDQEREVAAIGRLRSRNDHRQETLRPRFPRASSKLRDAWREADPKS